MNYIEINTDNDNFQTLIVKITRVFYQWIPHSIHDETFELFSKLLDVTSNHLSQNDFCLIVRSMLSKF